MFTPTTSAAETISARLVINSHQEFEQYVGKELGISSYLKISQDQINRFAEATLDHHWIHTDSKRAEMESPYKKTIAHGYLALSLIPYLWVQIAEVNNVKMLINYGVEQLKFNQPVLVDDEVRLRVKLQSISSIQNMSKVQLMTVLEVKNKKSAFSAAITFLYYFI